MQKERKQVRYERNMPSCSANISGQAEHGEFQAHKLYFKPEFSNDQQKVALLTMSIV